MKIAELTVTKVEFWELDEGDVFKINTFDGEEKIMMKCVKASSVNAIDLATGFLYTLADDSECMLVDATLTIKPYSEEP